MLGPELINLAVRPTPIFLEGVASLRIDEPGPRELGLANFQVVKGLVSIDRGQLLLNLNGVNQALIAPEYLRRLLGQNLFFRVQITPDGAILLKPIPAPGVKSPDKPAAQPPTQGVSLSGTPASVLQQLLNPDSLRQLPPPMATALAALGIAFSPAFSIEAQIARARELLQRAGIIRVESGFESSSRDATLPSLLLRLLGMGGVNQSTKDRARALLGEVDNRQERLVNGLRSDVINAELLTWVNGAPVELNLQRGPRGNPPTRQAWIINLYTRFAEGSDAWLRVEHLPAFKVRLDTWLTDKDLFNRALDSRVEFATEVSSFGLQLDHFAVYNQPRDWTRNADGDIEHIRVGERLDWSA